MEPLVSVIIPTYNAERYIRRSVHSAVSQSHSNLEIIAEASGDRAGAR